MKGKIKYFIVNSICLILTMLLIYTFYENIQLNKKLNSCQNRLTIFESKYNSTVKLVNNIYDSNVTHGRDITENKTEIDSIKSDITTLQQSMYEVTGKPTWYTGK